MNSEEYLNLICKYCNKTLKDGRVRSFNGEYLDYSKMNLKIPDDHITECEKCMYESFGRRIEIRMDE